MAAALIAMVCRLPTQIEDATEGARLQQSVEQAKGLSHQLLTGSRLDSEAFQAILKSYRLPKDFDKERKLRSLAIQAAWVEAAQVPLENARLCLQTLGLAADLAGRTNPRAESDMDCAWHLARAGALGCLENVKINLGSIKDAAIVSALAQQTKEIENQLEALQAAAGATTP